MARTDRPLSPHVGIYRWQISNALSIVHRATGVLLAVGALVLVGWLLAVASGPVGYAKINAWLQGPVGGLLLFGWSFSFFYHLCIGVRHLFWDAGIGYEKQQARNSGLVVVAAAVLLTVGLWMSALAGNGG